MGPCFSLLLLLGLLWASGVQATAYFVDFTGGLDTNNGTSSGTAWKNISRVNSQTFSPGDVIQFKRGEVWSGTTLVIDSNGTSGNPVTYTAYGTGAAPNIQRPGAPVSFINGINLTGNWNIIDNLKLSNVVQFAIYVQAGAANNIIQNTEITASGFGIWSESAGPLQILSNNVHDMVMFVNDAALDNDYGAVCFWMHVGSANTEIAYNTCKNAVAPSIDYGFDGGFVEFIGNGGNFNIHHNIADNTEGMTETDIATGDVTFAYNLFINMPANGICWHTAPTGNWVYANNTWVDTVAHTNFGFLICLSDWSKLSMRNNVFILHQNVGGTPGTHTNNRYEMVSGSIGFTLGTGESSGSAGLVGSGNYHLLSTSAARNGGANLGLSYTTDLDGVSVPQEGVFDMGAYEFVTGGAAPTNLRVLR